MLLPLPLQPPLIPIRSLRSSLLTDICLAFLFCPFFFVVHDSDANPLESAAYLAHPEASDLDSQAGYLSFAFLSTVEAELQPIPQSCLEMLSRCYRDVDVILPDPENSMYKVKVVYLSLRPC